MRYSGRLYPSVLLLVITFIVAGCGARDHITVDEVPYEDRLSMAADFYQAGENQNAVATLKEAAAKTPHRPEAYSMMGDIYYASEDLEGAAREYRRAIERGDSDAAVLNNLAWVETSLGRHGSALSLIERAIEMAPVPLYPYLDTRARILRSMGNLEEARKSAEMALRLTPAQDIEMQQDLKTLLDNLRVLEESGGQL
ncbi:tetratricopeptide repeat protein [bacterium]|nr:MAG: tetratricopeptide repeat protein [bacterium]